MRPAIQVEHVSKSFRRYRPDRPFMLQEVLARGVRGLRATEQFWALSDVSFSVARGRAAGIIGTNGSGKSTLLRLVGGIGRPDSGRIAVAGRIGALLDLGSGFHPDLSGRENVIVGGVLAGLTRQEVLKRFDQIVEFSGVEAFIDNPMRTYSSGMHMRLAFSTAVHTKPDVLVIDEVLAVGDAAFQAKCLAKIAQFKAEGCSILLVSHGLAIVKRLCDEVLWMNGGRLMAQGPVPDVVKQYQAHVGYSMEPGPDLDDAARARMSG
jgi:lipopolysaccharide transport system ATP-binding protein